jgi:hypothetical protein
MLTGDYVLKVVPQNLSSINNQRRSLAKSSIKSFDHAPISLLILSSIAFSDIGAEAAN